MNRLSEIDFTSMEKFLSANGYLKIEKVLTGTECAFLINLYPKDELFRSTVEMIHHNFGEGIYRYFKYPLPALVQSLRAILFRQLAPVANRWMEMLNISDRFPAELDQFLKVCHQNQQTKPTPLIFHYKAGGYNNLHTDTYGKIFFPFQAVFVLNMKDRDFEGGDFVLAEGDRGGTVVEHVVPATCGDMIVFASKIRPELSTSMPKKVFLRHGVRKITSGNRSALGIILQDAK